MSREENIPSAQWDGEGGKWRQELNIKIKCWLGREQKENKSGMLLIMIISKSGETAYY